MVELSDADEGQPPAWGMIVSPFEPEWMLREDRLPDFAALVTTYGMEMADDGNPVLPAEVLEMTVEELPYPDENQEADANAPLYIYEALVERADGREELHTFYLMNQAYPDTGIYDLWFDLSQVSREEAEVRKRYNVTHYDAYFLARVGLPEQPLPEDFPRRIYISFDVDGLDSSLMPATGTPSPGGISWREAQFILERCARDREIVGLDVVELAPIPGLHHANFTAAKLTHLLMALALQGRTDLQGKKA